ncbi:MAG TPA: TIGR03435 family protein [Acidobacteriaceae bacterium]|jgi:uncharacterized protein (TIGR03435 family)|nr:TIGR03435 family protein [Acidobacteriaceae bacterium]
MKSVLAGVVFLISMPGAVFAQTAGTQPRAATSAPALPTFQIADVHVSPHHNAPELDGGLLYGDRYIVHQATMVDLITAAYGLKPANVQGGPPWLERDRFDITAKAPPATPPATLKLMLRALLADRFHLVLHEGITPMPVYALSVGDGKLGLKTSTGDDPANCHDDAPDALAPAPGAVRNARLACVHMSMEQFADILHDAAAGYFDYPVVDATGLKGAYDFKLTWTGRGQLVRAGADGISLFDAVDKQLGLKLAQRVAPRPVTLVDSVDQKPTPNTPNLATLLPPLPPAAFEVAVIRPSAPGSTQANGRVSGGNVDLHNFTLKDIINVAWSFEDSETEMIANAPKWLDKDRFDISAKVSNESISSDAGPANLSMPVEDLLQMLRGLLIERFAMRTHMEDRPADVYVLTAANPKLQKTADPAARTRCKQGPGRDGKDPRITNPVRNRLVTCQNITVAQLSEELQTMASGYIRRPVFDETGLKGEYDLTLSFSGARQSLPAVPSQQGEATTPNAALSVFDAITQQLGLKLEQEKRPLQALVIDHMEEKPTEN